MNFRMPIYSDKHSEKHIFFQNGFVLVFKPKDLSQLLLNDEGIG
jgi:hypothetical protein